VVLVFEAGALLAEPLIEIPVDTQNGERGLVGLAIHPDFAENGYLYVYFTTPEPRNRVARFTVAGDAADPGSEDVIWENLDTAADWHHGGAIFFANDGTLFITTGDQFDASTSQDLAGQHGKLLRVNDDGSIPADNPFLSDPLVPPEIYAYGLRNPYRASYDVETGTLYIGDVGGNGTASWEEIDIAASGANYGWPDQEGDDCYISDCSEITLPIFSYQHDDPTYFNESLQGCITIGPRYRGNAFPDEYAGNLFLGDYANRWIRRVTFDGDDNVESVSVFDSAPDSGTIVDLEEGPDGALYYVTVGIAWSGSSDEGAVYRIRYTGDLNDPPVPVASASPTVGPTPLEVEFSSAGSADPDGAPRPLAFAWDFGDGSTSTEEHPTHSYETIGMYDAVLTLSDGAASASAPAIEITAGNAPAVTIGAPEAGTAYRAGDSISYAGSATDSEDGAMAAAAFEWRIVLVHAGHVHPFLGPISGIDAGSFTIPATGHPPEDTYYEIQLTVTDSDALLGRAARAVSPEVATLVLDSDPSGIPVFLDGQAEPTPRTYASIPNYEHAVEAQESFLLGDVLYLFEEWADGGDRVRTFVTPEEGGSLTAIYAPASSIRAAVDGDERNADYHPPQGEQYANAYDAFGLCIGRDGEGEYQSGFQFALDLPQGAAILSATLSLTATADQYGSPTAEIRAYAVDSAEPFDKSHTHALTEHHDVGGASIEWSFPAFGSGEVYDSPDLAVLIEEVVARAGWEPGNVLGVVLDGKPSGLGEWRCVRNWASGSPAELLVRYATEDPGPLFERGDCNGDGGDDISDPIFLLDWLFGPGGSSIAREDACDTNDDESLDIADPIYHLSALFTDGALPPAPYNECGSDGLPAGALDCSGYAPCP
ncbi:MAG: PQQ-dependent sugar dehydrogenase, partial [Actinobacteria bacterium]|nr:PQQ-dependent sugar dehydrogenase [Actinomycetota bacterium]